MGRSISLASAVVLLLAVASSAGAAPSSERIVFQAAAPGALVAQLFSIQTDGTGLKQLTKGSKAAIDPAFSPTGKRIAFARFGVGIFTMNRDGSGLRRVSTNGRDASPAWSPDGKSIAFVRPVGSKWGLYVVRLTGGKAKPKRLSQAPPAGRPSWTTAGLLVPTGGDLLRVDPSSGKVLKYYGANIDAIWGLNSVTVSPAVSVLLYVGSREPESGDMECGDGPCQRFGLFQESLTGKKKLKPRLIVKNTGPAAFSPDGKRFAYAAGGALVLQSLATGATKTIATGALSPTTAAPPAWH